MEVIKGKRGSGKTYELIKIALENDYCFVCHSNEQRLILKKENPELNVVTFREYICLRLDVCDSLFVIDDIDLCLNNVKAISVDGDSEKNFLDNPDLSDDFINVLKDIS